MGGQAGGIGVVVEQLADTVVDVVGVVVVEVVRLQIEPDVHLEVGGL